MPIEESASGNIQMLPNGLARIVKGELFETLVEGGGQRYVSHFATCPNAKSHRRSKS